MEVVDPGIGCIVPKSSHVSSGLIAGKPDDLGPSEPVWKVEHEQSSCPRCHNKADVLRQFSQREEVVDKTLFRRGLSASGRDGIVCCIHSDHEEGILRSRGDRLSGFVQPRFKCPRVVEICRAAQEQ